MPNPWDAGTAKLLASLGFEALATTSLGFASSRGRVDGTLSIGREELIANCREIASATELPVNADLENGYADDPEEAATIIRLAADAGIVADRSKMPRAIPPGPSTTSTWPSNGLPPQLGQRTLSRSRSR